MPPETVASKKHDCFYYRMLLGANRTTEQAQLPEGKLFPSSLQPGLHSFSGEEIDLPPK